MWDIKYKPLSIALGILDSRPHNAQRASTEWESRWETVVGELINEKIFF